MSVPVFGDLAGLATRHLGTAAAMADGGLPGEDVAAAVRPVRRMALTLAHCLGDVAAYDEVEAVTSSQLATWVRAVVDAREALRLAASSLHPYAAPGPAEATPDGTMAAVLDTAAVSLAAGRDLLRTHLSTGADGTPLDRSDWAAVVTSGPVTMALLNEIACWSQQLALLTGRLSVAHAAESASVIPVHQGLASACHWLVTADAAIRSTQRTGTLTLPDTNLLMAIPARAVPERRPPQTQETTAELCQGAVISAIRLRASVCTAAGQAAWTELVTAESLRWTATAAAVACHISENILRMLAGDVGSDPLDTENPLRGAAEAASHASASWRNVVASWSQMTTETTGLTSPGIPDAGDLIVRLGRLAFDDAEWTPARARQARLRGPAGVAVGDEQAMEVLAAVHHAADTLARVAAAEVDAVGTAIGAWRLYAPTRTLPEYVDVPYRYGPATPADTAALIEAYRAAADATTRAVAALDTVAIGLNAPSRLLAAARAATRQGRAPHVSYDADLRAAHGQSADPATGPSSGNYPPPALPPGPVEQAVRDLGTKADPGLLLRAHAIDTAARQLIAEARRVARSAAERKPARKRPPSRAGPAVQRAAENFPPSPAATVARRAGASEAAYARRSSSSAAAVPAKGGRVLRG
jgi:hypothetical protein